jgi:hypothetical protein
VVDAQAWIYLNLHSSTVSPRYALRKGGMSDASEYMQEKTRTEVDIGLGMCARHLGLSYWCVGWMEHSPELMKATSKSSSRLRSTAFSGLKKLATASFSDSIKDRKSDGSTPHRRPRRTTARSRARPRSPLEKRQLSAPNSAFSVGAPGCTVEHGDHASDQLFDAPEGCCTTWRTCQPFLHCCGHQQRHRRQLERTLPIFEAA